jgi:arylsulfatase A-like enzyme
MPWPAGDTATHGFEAVGTKKGDHVTAASAVEFLRQRRDKPFLLVSSFLNPHNICEWARSEPLPDGEVGTPPALSECPPARANAAPPKDEPDIMTLMRRSYQSNRLFPVGNFDEKKWREYAWAYHRMIEKVDAEIGKVLAALRETGQEERTVVVFLADHGDCQGAHKWNQKTVFYEESSRVPLIISHKGVTKAGSSGRLAHTGVDLIPTLCDYAGIPKPEGLPGVSLRAGRDSREFVVVCNRMAQGAPVDGRSPVPDGRMVRSRRFKYCAYSEGDLRESLVDLEADPGEMVNLAREARFADELGRHRKMLASWSRITHDPFPQ